MTKKEIEFLRESNAIEGVFSNLMLQQAQIAWEYLKDQKVLNTAIILTTHRILMFHSLLKSNEKGYFRTEPVYIGGREGLEHHLIPGYIDGWCNDAMTTIKVPGKNGKNIQLDHIEYEKIHPFLDGNGRTGRMFLNWERLQAKLPILIIKASERNVYYEWFRTNSEPA